MPLSNSKFANANAKKSANADKIANTDKFANAYADILADASIWISIGIGVGIGIGKNKLLLPFSCDDWVTLHIW